MTEGVEFESVIDGDRVKLKLAVENLNIERRCDTEYHLAYTQLLQKGILPRAALEKRMADLDVWTQKDETQLSEIQRLLLEAELKLDAATTHEHGLAIAGEMGGLRADCLKLVEVKAAVLSNSCESLADQIRRDAYLAFATQYLDTGKPVFKDYDDFMSRAESQVVLDARERILAIASSEFNNSLTSLPEVHYVRGVDAQIEAEDEKAAKLQRKKAGKKKGAKKTRGSKKATKKKKKTTVT